MKFISLNVKLFVVRIKLYALGILEGICIALDKKIDALKEKASTLKAQLQKQDEDTAIEIPICSI